MLTNCYFNCNVPANCKVELLFNVSMSIRISPFITFLSFENFLVGLFVFILSIYRSYLYRICWNYLSDRCALKIFSQSILRFLTFLIVVLLYLKYLHSQIFLHFLFFLLSFLSCIRNPPTATNAKGMQIFS